MKTYLYIAFLGLIAASTSAASLEDKIVAE
jgi:hypothetical protein